MFLKELHWCSFSRGPGPIWAHNQMIGTKYIITLNSTKVQRPKLKKIVFINSQTSVLNWNVKLVPLMINFFYKNDPLGTLWLSFHKKKWTIRYPIETDNSDHRGWGSNRGSNQNLHNCSFKDCSANLFWTDTEGPFLFQQSYSLLLLCAFWENPYQLMQLYN